MCVGEISLGGLGKIRRSGFICYAIQAGATYDAGVSPGGGRGDQSILSAP